MKKLLALLALAAFVFPYAPAAAAGAQDDDHGRHRGWYKRGDDDDDKGYRHDNGKHKGWYRHHDRGYDSWDYNGERIHHGHYNPYGRYPYVVMSLSSAASIRARGTSFSTTNPIGSSRPTTLRAAATGNATASTSMTTTTILAPGWYVLFNSRARPLRSLRVLRQVAAR
ncbi:MAG: hypothetical protein HRJ53_07905 [Acidobacteria bacterium Pan2503]|uniref:Uncharacterized protein n=1 Tax=Candidatus Acidiferrum panamense TaxID=2741543 RepID=A0A7V8NP63_9BACT|nr:hypothetical protein [Candidatus Acidoferrum panamensis]